MIPDNILSTIRNSIRSALVHVWRNFGIRQAVLESRLRKNRSHWRSVRENQSQSKLELHNKILLIPSDPYLLTSSLGDQAMIGSILDYWKAKRQGIEIYIATADSPAEDAARALGAVPLRVMGRKFSVSSTDQAMLLHGFQIAVLMGADGLDGSYDPSFSAEQLITVDMAARYGAESYITGFSVSQSFHRDVAVIFDELDQNVRINLRDPLSLKRFEAGSKRKGHLVADVAFLLHPRTSERVDAVLTQVRKLQQSGFEVAAFNIHPLLLELEDRHRFPDFIAAAASVLRMLAQRKKVAFLLLSHDTRGSSSDRLGLEPLYAQLSDALGERILLPSEQLTAVEIKALVKELDLVISGRMHLMIASLGSGTPVVGLDYKDKMEGLLQLLALDSKSLIPATQIMADPKECANRIALFLDRCEEERAQIKRASARIHHLSLRNFGDAA